MMFRILVIACALATLGAPASAETAPKPETPASAILTNGRSATATTIVLTIGDTAVKVAHSLASNGRITVSLPKGSDCMVGVSALFADNARAETHVDICKDNSILFTE